MVLVFDLFCGIVASHCGAVSMCRPVRCLIGVFSVSRIRHCDHVVGEKGAGCFPADM